MHEIDNPEPVPTPISRSELPTGSITRDVSIFLIKLLIILLVINFFISSDASNFFLSLIYAFILIYLFSSTIRDGYTIFHYYNAMKYLGGRYLNNTKPVCPFLLVTPSGFRCQAEFKIPFSKTDDLPRCHDEDLFKAHWLDKAPGILERAKQEGNPIKLRNYISTLSGIKYKAAADFFLAILEAPPYTSIHNWIIDSLREYNEISREDLDKIIETRFNDEIIKGRQVNKIEIQSAYNRILEYFISTEMIIFDKSNNSLKIISDEDLLIKRKALKTRDNSAIRDGALIALSKLKNTKVLPLIIESLGLDTKRDKRLIEVLASYQEDAIESLKTVINNGISDSTNKAYLAIEALGMMKNDINYDYLIELWNNRPKDDDLLSSYLLSALNMTNDTKTQDLVFDAVYSSNIEEALYDTAKEIIISDPESYLANIFAKLEFLPAGDLSQDQEDIREISIILLEDMESFILKDWLKKQELSIQSDYLEILKKEGQTELLNRIQ